MFLCFIFCICVPVLEHCVLCVYTFRPLSIPRPSPSDVSPNKLQNVKSRLNFHSIFQLASHQRGLSAQPTPNLLLTSIGFLMKIERHTYKIRIYIHRFDNRENGIFLVLHEFSQGFRTRAIYNGEWGLLWEKGVLPVMVYVRPGRGCALLCCAVCYVLCCEL